MSSVRLVIPESCCEGKFLVSHGVQRVDTLNGVVCSATTFMPRRWERGSPRHIVLADIPHISSEYRAGTDIAVFRLPQHLIQACEEIGYSRMRTIQDLDVQRAANTRGHKHLVAQFRSYLIGELGMSNNDLLDLEITFGEPGLASVSSDETDGSYVGLHIDDWDQLPVPNRDQSRVLFCANLGSEPRYFMYMDLTINAMATRLSGSRGGNYAHLHPDAILTGYLEDFPDEPVFAFKMEPHDVYIAPIQNVVHEGSTMQTSSPDVQIMFLGYPI